MKNLVSIIMPVYNSKEYLEESIGSVIRQSYENWELICVDDGSIDNSIEILEKFQNQYENIKVYSQQNLGPAQARRLGIERSKGSYIAYLDSDDCYSEDYLYETLKQALKTDADVTMPVLIGGWKSEKQYNFNDQNDLKLGDVIESRIAFLRTFPWSMHGLNLYKAEHVKKYALTDISNVNNFNADEYLTRYLLLFSNKIVISKGVYYYRFNEKSITQKFSIRMYSSLIVDKLLFNLALKEGFSDKELTTMAISFLRNKFYLKYSYLTNYKIISKEDRLYIENQLNKEYGWESYLKMNSIREAKYCIFLKSNNIFLIKVIELRKKLKDVKLSLK